MSNWPAMMDENRMQLRASCNACNESKVRCSQQKPTCTRCERSGTECIYGLSRRTHKDAPPISFPPSQRGGRLSRPGRPPRLSSNGHTLTSTNSSSNTAARFNSGAGPVEPTETHNNNANFLADYAFPMPTETDSTQLLDFSCLLNDNVRSSTMAPGHFPTREAEFTHPKPWALGPVVSVSPNRDATDIGASWALNGEDQCTCHTGVTELLASMRRRGSINEQRLSLDAQLAKLKQCVVSCETSIECAHGHEDSEPIHFMAVALLMGYVIDNFKMLASEFTSHSWSSLSSWSSSAAEAEIATSGNSERGSKSTSTRVTTPSSTDMSLGGLMEPRLSWGVLELEEDDEMDLRRRLYLLSFRKLERLLSQLTLHLRELHNACPDLPDPSRYTAFVTACGYMRLWLEKKVDDTKKVFSISVRDDRMETTHG